MTPETKFIRFSFSIAPLRVATTRLLNSVITLLDSFRSWVMANHDQQSRDAEHQDRLTSASDGHLWPRFKQPIGRAAIPTQILYSDRAVTRTSSVPTCLTGLKKREEALRVSKLRTCIRSRPKSQSEPNRGHFYISLELGW
jgi:hypothetical protein